MPSPRYIFLNALPLQALNITKPTKLLVTPVKPSSLKQLIPLMRGKIENYIRHPATVQLINKLFGLDLQPSSQLYSYSSGDVIYVFTLKKPIRGKEIDHVSEDDVVIYRVEILSS